MMINHWLTAIQTGLKGSSMINNDEHKEGSTGKVSQSFIWLIALGICQCDSAGVWPRFRTGQYTTNKDTYESMKLTIMYIRSFHAFTWFNQRLRRITLENHPQKTSQQPTNIGADIWWALPMVQTNSMGIDQYMEDFWSQTSPGSKEWIPFWDILGILRPSSVPCRPFWILGRTSFKNQGSSDDLPGWFHL